MSDTPSPSPYAPGIISDERPPPRPAGRAFVFLAATFVMTFVTASSFSTQWVMRSGLVSGHAGSTLELFITAAKFSGALILLWAYLSDRVAVWGARREGYLLLTGLTMAITWLLLAFLGSHDVAWVLAAVEFGLAASVTRAAVVGGLAEIGQRRAATGRLAAANVGLTQVALLVSAPLAFVLGFLPLAVSVGISAALSIAVVVLIVALPDRGSPAPDPAALPTVTIPKFLRSRTFWSSVAFLAIGGLATVPREIFMWHLKLTEPAAMILPTSLRLVWIDQAATIAGAIGYLLLCRRIPLGKLLRIALVANALALIAFGRTLESGRPGALEVAAGILAACQGLAAIAFLDLALRAAPRGREAFGAILLGGFPVVSGNFVAPLAGLVDASAERVAWFAAAAAIAGAVAVALLPRALVGTRDGERATT